MAGELTGVETILEQTQYRIEGRVLDDVFVEPPWLLVISEFARQAETRQDHSLASELLDVASDIWYRTNDQAFTQNREGYVAMAATIGLALTMLREVA